MEAEKSVHYNWSWTLLGTIHWAAAGIKIDGPNEELPISKNHKYKV